ncbi:Protein of unknown function (DUF1493) [Paraburkholderia caribensis MBA4]|uniref:Uncharacterized protein n=1 Tax=Paraburkholderia caribensis MBA4 TaxID=1323664 RepID=A0A0P0REG1_9BURK|nr:DUF1493 family protein [Paraburkholderia caribensis]ALL66790.1 Protein of unknown function (DUF1493) [Paraburkholderia caribensis MBA4]
MDDPLWVELVKFAREEVGGPRLFGKDPAITQSTTLCDDFGVDGDDAIEFIDKFFDKFDIEGDFPYARYIGPESPTNLIFMVPILIGMMFRRLIRRERAQETDLGHHALTFGMLYDAASVGRWDTKAIEDRQVKRHQKDL